MMTHDFAKKQKKKIKSPNRRPAQKVQPRKGLPGWVWFVAGVAITVFFQFLIHLGGMETKGKPQKPVHQPEITWPEKSAEQAAKPKKPAIQFYDMLKEQEVKVSENVVTGRDEGTYEFSLQAGAFRHQQDAEQLRAEIILLGLEARVKKTTTTKGSVWYRIIVGPFKSRSLLAQSRSKLLDNGIRSIRIKNS